MTNENILTNNKLFNKSLFFNFFGQIKIPGIIFLISGVFFSAIVPIIGLISVMQDEYYKISIPSVEMLAPSLYAIVFLGSIVLTLCGFNFLNKRSSSDYYHSVPVKRQTLFTCIALAILAWQFITIIATVLISSLFYMLLGVSINPYYIPLVILFFMVSSTLVTACCLIAVSVTGTFLSNISVTLIILFLPRLILSLINFSVMVIDPLTPLESFGFLFNYMNNLPFSMIFGSFFQSMTNSYSYESMFFNASGYIFTLVLSMIFIFLAAYFFVKRKSETAEKSAPNKFMQMIYRCGVTLPFLIVISVAMIFTNDSYTVSQIAIIFIIISLIIYCSYELITTKKFKSALKSLPVFIILVVFSLGAGLLSSAISSNINPFSIKSEDVKSISVSNNGNNGIVDLILSNSVRSEDRAFIETMTSHNPPYGDSLTANIKVDFYKTNGKKHSRIMNIPFNSLINSNLINDDIINKLKDDLDKVIRSNITLNVNSGNNLSKEDIITLWDLYTEELKALPNNKFLKNLNLIGNSDSSLDTFNVTIRKGIHDYTVYCEITPDMPKTQSKYLELFTNSKKSTRIAEVLKEENIGNSNANLQYYYQDLVIYSKGQPAQSFSTNDTMTKMEKDSYDDETPKAEASNIVTDIDFLKCILKIVNTSSDLIDESKPYVKISFNFGSKDGYHTLYEFHQLSDEAITFIEDTLNIKI